MRSLRNVMPMFLLCPALLGSGCGKSEGAIGEDATLSSKIEGWSEGAGYSINAIMLSAPMNSPVLAAGHVDDKGAFSIKLPSSEAVAPYLLAANPLPEMKGCTALPTYDPVDMKIASLDFSAKKEGASSIPLILLNRVPDRSPRVGDTAAGFMYSDHDGSIHGTLKCTGPIGSISVGYDLTLSKGWNSVVSMIKELSDTPASPAVSSELHSGAIPNEVKWRKQK